MGLANESGPEWNSGLHLSGVSFRFCIADESVLGLNPIPTLPISSGRIVQWHRHVEHQRTVIGGTIALPLASRLSSVVMASSGLPEDVSQLVEGW